MPFRIGHTLRSLRDRFHRGKPVATPIVLEGQVWECGVAALAIILGYYGCHVPLEELRRAMGISRDGVNAVHIRDAACRYGLKVRVFRCEPERIAEIGFPCIAHLNFIHFVVVEGIHGDRVYLNDQGCGPHDIPWHEFAESFTGVALAFEPGPEFRTRPRPPSRLRLFLRHTRPAWPALGAAALLSVLYGGALVAFALALGTRMGGSAGCPLHASLTLGVTALLASMTLFLRGRCLDAAGRALAGAHVPRSLRHVLGLPSGYFTLRSSRFVSARVLAGHHLATLVAGEPGSALMDLLAACVLAVALWRAAPPLHALGLGLGALLVAGWWRVYGRRRGAWRRLRHAGIEAADFTAWRLHNMENTRLAGRDAEAFATLAGMQATHLTAAQEAGAEEAHATLVVRAAPAATLALALGLAAGAASEPPALASALALAAGFCLCLRGLLKHGRDYPVLGELAAKLDELYAHEGDPPRATVPGGGSPGAVAVEGLSFGYSTARPPLLEEVGIHAAPGGQVGITGPSGSGKSTLVQLICGLHIPWAGHVAAGGPCALVSGSPALFEGSVRNNVSLWDDAIPEESITAALKDACLWDWVESREGHLDAAVRPAGANLSGGQRRRLGIARALARNPAVLVLDETLDSLEAPLAEEIRANLRRRGCTVLIVSQRRAILAQCEAVYGMSSGCIAPLSVPLPDETPEPPAITEVPMDEAAQVRQDPESEGTGAPGAPDPSSTLTAEILAALRAVASALPGADHPAAGPGTLPPGRDSVRALAEASGLFVRRVRLRAPRWWEQDNGPLIAFRGGRPVALLPAPGPSYRAFDPVAGKTLHLDAAVAAELDANAYMPYPQPSDRQTTFRRLLFQGLRAGRGDLATAIACGTGLWLVRLALASLACPAGEPVPAVWLLALGLGPAAIGLALAEGTAMLRLKGKASLALQPSIWGRILRLPVSFFRYASPAEIAGWSQQLGALIRQTAGIPPVVAGAVPALAAGLLLMYRADSALTGLALLLLPLGPLCATACAWQESRIERRRFRLSVSHNEVLQRLLGDVPGMRLIGAQRVLSGRWMRGFREEEYLALRALRWRRAAGGAGVLIPIASLAALSAAAAGATPFLSFGILFAFSAGVVGSLGEALAEAIRLKPQVERIRTLLETPLERRPDAVNPGIQNGSLEAVGIRFTYPGARGRALDDVSIRIGPGEMVAVAGPSGSGKSTLLRLLLGFDEPEAGEIRWGGHRFAEVDRDAVRRSMDAVLQDEYLPPATVRSHIAGMSPFGLREAWQAARLAGLEADILAMPMGMQTLAHSEKLSAGQAQRIQIARALLHQPRILFLDETTAGLDPNAQARLFARIRSLEITCVVITHRADALALADRVYVLEKGRVAEEGTYVELMRSGGALCRVVGQSPEERR